MRTEEFEELVAGVLDDLPEDFAVKLQNVEVFVRDRPSGEELEQQGVEGRYTLLGLYEGVPLDRRGWFYEFALPDRISIFRVPIEEYCRTQEVPVAEMVRKVVLHEVAHHFGIPDKRLRELGY